MRFADGSEVPADLVVMAVGIRPNMALAQQAGLGLLDMFRIDSPMQAAQLEELAQALKRQRAQVERRQVELDPRREGGHQQVMRPTVRRR